MVNFASNEVVTSLIGLGDSLVFVSGRIRFTTSGRGILSMANFAELTLPLLGFSATVPNCARGPDGVGVAVWVAERRPSTAETACELGPVGGPALVRALSFEIAVGFGEVPAAC